MAAAQIQFVDMFPGIPSYNYMFMLEAMTYKVILRIPTSVCPEELTVQAWSNQFDRFNPEGAWHAVTLKHIDSDNNLHTYGHSEIITSAYDFEYTFRYHLHCGSEWIWSHGWQGNGFVHVEPPREYDKWTLGPDYHHIIGALHLGNFIAATNAKECGFTHVLNVANNLDMVYEKNTVDYLKVPMDDGAHNPIPCEKIKEAVLWIAENDKENNKILVNCRAGIGRAGSVAVAYTFYKNKQMNFNQAYEYVFSKRFVYPHRDLQETLYRLFR